MLYKDLSPKIFHCFESYNTFFKTKKYIINMFEESVT